MITISVPYRQGKYDTGTFQEFVISNSRFQVGKTYTLKAIQHKKTKKKWVVLLTDTQTVTWDKVTHDMAYSVLGDIVIIPAFKPNETRSRPARKGDLMMFLMKEFEEKEFKKNATTFMLLTLTVQGEVTKERKLKTPKIINEPKQITFPTFEDIRKGG